MAQTGLTYPTVAANNTDIGTVAWSNVNNALADDANNASCAPGAAVSNYLLLTGFDFSALGDSDTINAIQATAIRSSNSNNRISDNSIRLFVAGVASGDNKAAAGGWPSAEASPTYGDLTSDSWGLTLTGADVKASNFGIAIAINGNAGWQGFVDTIALNLDYTAAASGVEIVVNQATLELAAQAVNIDLGTPPGVEIVVNQATLELAAQMVSVDLGSLPGVEIVVNQATLELAAQTVSVDLGAPPAGVEIAVNTAVLELVAQPVSIQAPGAAILIGVPTPLPISVDSLDYVDHVAGTISHSVVASSNPGADEILLKSTPSGYLRLERLGIGKDPVAGVDVLGDIQLTGDLFHTADLTILATGGDVLFEDTDIQAHNWISGTTGWGINWNGNADFRDITADSLTVEAFIADINLALAGSQIITKSLGIIAQAFTIPAVSGTLTVYDLPGFENAQVFDDGDTVRLRYIDRSGGGLVVGDAWGTVSGYTDLGSGEQSWTWTYVSGSVGQVIGEGGIALDYGVSGDGYVHTTTLDPAGSPYTEIGTWVTDPSNSGNHTIHVRLGQLDGITGIGDEWGLWAGQDTDKYLLLSDTNFEAHSLRLSLYNSSSDETFRIDPNVPSVAMGDVLPTGLSSGGDGFWMGEEGGLYKVRIGDPAGVALRWTGNDLNLRNSLNQAVIVFNSSGESYFGRPMTLGTDGGIWQGSGTFSAPTTGLKFWNDSGIGKFAGYNSGTEQFYMDTDGKFYGGGGNTIIDETGISIAAKSGSSTPDPENSIRFFDTLAELDFFTIGAAVPTGSRYGILEVGGGQNNYLLLKASVTDSAKVASVRLLAEDTGASAKSSSLSLSASGVLAKDSYPTALMSYLTAPLTSTSWDGDSKTSSNNGTIDLSAVFGVPGGVTAVLIYCRITGSAINDRIRLGPSSGQPDTMVLRTQVATIDNHCTVVIPCDSNGDIYFSAFGTLDVTLAIWGYAV